MPTIIPNVKSNDDKEDDIDEEEWSKDDAMKDNQDDNLTDLLMMVYPCTLQKSRLLVRTCWSLMCRDLHRQVGFQCGIVMLRMARATTTPVHPTPL